MPYAWWLAGAVGVWVESLRPNCYGGDKMNQAGEKLISESEGRRLKAYLCPAGVPTIGRGHTDGVTMEDVRNGRTITEAEEAAMFKSDMVRWEKDVRACLTRQPDENQLAAMVSLAFNIGMPGFRKSTVVRAFNKGDDPAAAQAFGLWNKITDPSTKKLVVNEGLVKRRAREAALYLRDTPQQEFTATVQDASTMPQEVAPPVTMTASKINISAAATGVSALAAMGSSVASSIKGFKDSFESLGHWAVPALLVVVLCCAAWTIYERTKQRREGVA